LEDYHDKQLELYDGLLIVTPPTDSHASVLAAKVGSTLIDWEMRHPSGYVLGANGGYELAPNTVLVPDASFISKTRLLKLTDDYVNATPEIALEVHSFVDDVLDLNFKARIYLTHGTRLVWLLYPEFGIGQIYDQLTDVPHRVEAFEGGDVLPGFKLPLRELFKA
jgi:Uma2 family endonuclease